MIGVWAYVFALQSQPESGRKLLGLTATGWENAIVTGLLIAAISGVAVWLWKHRHRPVQQARPAKTPIPTRKPPERVRLEKDD